MFAKLLARYGSAWLQKWDGIPMDAVKADWGDQIDCFGMVAITHALLNLPEDYPPTAAQFRRLCLGRPEPAQKRLPVPMADPDRVAHALSSLRDAWKSKKPTQWAYDLQEREKNGEELTPAQKAAWRQALERVPIEGITGWFTDIPVEALPPGMRPDAMNRD